MKTFFFGSVNRRNLADVFFGDAVERMHVSEVHDLDELIYRSTRERDEVLALWSQNPRERFELPSVIVCADGGSNDWMAWLTTYFAKMRPVTALVRLMEQTEFENTVRRFRDPRLDSAQWPIVGLIMGEVLASSGIPDRQLDSLPVNAYESTLAFALFRSHAISGDIHDFNSITEAWENVRRVTKQHPRAIDAANITKICELVLRAGRWIETGYSFGAEDHQLLALCESVIEGQSDSSLTREISRALDFDVRMDGSREERVLAFSAFVRNLPTSSHQESRGLLSFVLGFLASRIAPGTIQHSSVLEPIATHYPESLIWYGFCAGCARRKSTERSSASRSGADLPAISRWIARSILRSDSPWDTPACDISWKELMSLFLTGGDPLTAVIRATSGSAIVELSPAVWTVINVSARTEGSEGGRRSRGDRNEHLMALMEENLARLNATFRELSAGQSNVQQQSLFPSKRRKS